MSYYILVIVVLGLSFFISGVFALRWAWKSGQFQKLEEGSRVVFTEEEPEGVPGDAFPTARKAPKHPKN